jgi:PAS domain S-box-containing protein
MVKGLLVEKLEQEIKRNKYEKPSLTSSNDYLELTENLERVRDKQDFLLNNILDTILELDERGKIIYVNPQIGNLFGFKPTEVIGKKATKFIHPEDLEYVFKSIRKLFISDEDFEIEFRSIHKNGDFIPVYAKGILRCAERKKSLFLILRDISLKEANEELKDYEKKFQVLFNYATSGIAYHKIIYDAIGSPINYLITDVNPQYEKILGIKKNTIINHTGTDAYKVEKAPYLEIYSKVAETQESVSFETYFPPMDLHFKISVISPRKGEFITCFEDITENKKSEQRIKESEEKFRTITEQSFIGIAILQDFNFKYANQQFSNTLGFSFDEMLQWNPGEFFKLVHPEDREMVQSLAEEKYYGTNGVLADLQFRIIKKTGEIIWLEIISKTITFEGKPADLLATLDITEKIEAERLILEENKKLLELNKMRKDIITRVSHELKTPLTSMYGASQILLKHLIDKIDGEVLSFIEIFHRGALRLRKLVANLIDASRIETGKLDLRLKRENLIKIIEECVDEMNYLTNNRNQTINIDLPEESYWDVDKIRLQQVITNILSNAIKNTPKDGSIYVSLLESNNHLDIKIKDTGIGLTEKEKGLLFEKFGKIERYGMDLGVDIEGSGLGLYISKEIVDSHGGQILVESDGRYKGATFTVRLFKT